MKFDKPFRGVPDGEIYPVDYQPGDECPPELLASAVEQDAVEQEQAEQAEQAEAEPKKPARAK